MYHEYALIFASRNKQVLILKSSKLKIFQKAWELRTALLAKSYQFQYHQHNWNFTLSRKVRQF